MSLYSNHQNTHWFPGPRGGSDVEMRSRESWELNSYSKQTRQSNIIYLERWFLTPVPPILLLSVNILSSTENKKVKSHSKKSWNSTKDFLNNFSNFHSLMIFSYITLLTRFFFLWKRTCFKIKLNLNRVQTFFVDNI